MKPIKKILYIFTAYPNHSSDSLPESHKIIAKNKRHAQDYLQSLGYVEIRWCSESTITELL